MPKHTPEEIENIFNSSDKQFIGDDVDLELEMPVVDINIKEIDDESSSVANLITSKLAGYYFSQEYIDEHPYIPTKIMLVMNNVRRLVKMLAVNERAQDSLLLGVSYNAGKGSLYTSLTSLQNSMLSIQTQLNSFIKDLEEIFQKMQEDCDKTFKEKDLEKESDGTLTIRGARELLKQIEEMQKNGKLASKIQVDDTPIEKSEMTAEELDSELSMEDLIKK